MAPFILVLFEWWHNSMIVTTGRLWLYLMFGLAYILMLCVLEKFIYPTATIYHSLDFVNSPIQAFICAVIVIAVWVTASFVWPYVTKIKFQNYHKA